MAQFIYVIRPCRPTFLADATDAEKAKVGEHFAYLQERLAAGELILAGRTQEETPLGIAIFEVEDEAAAQRFTDEDPAVKAGVFIAEIKPFAVALLRS